MADSSITAHGSGTLAAIVGIGAIMPQAPDLAAFWRNIVGRRYCITDVPPERWDPNRYYDPDRAAPDKTYSRIGGWVREFEWDPIGWRMPMPPRVTEQMDEGQQWSVAASRMALQDAGWPERTGDPERTAVIIGNAMGGERHYDTAMRVMFPEFAASLRHAPTFGDLPEDVRTRLLEETEKYFKTLTTPITEDTMPGELANITAGRVANLFNFRGPNFTTDAACASAMAAMRSAIEGLQAGRFDLAVTGGIDRNMGIAAFVKFCKIGALSATGTRPYGEGADGFVMGEGAAVFALKRVQDAERDGDRVYAIVRSISGSSDGRGKGITAPNPVGQKLAVERAWRRAGLDPATCTLVEGHGTSTAVGDVAEVRALTEGFGDPSIPARSIALGSVKSNIGHLKAAAGAAGLVKAAMALHEKVLPPSLNAERLNPNLDWSTSPFRVNTELRSWERPANGLRRAGVSAFGFGGTNFHAVLEEYVPGAYGNGAVHSAVADVPWQAGSRAAEGGPESLPPVPTASASTTAQPRVAATSQPQTTTGRKRPLRGLVVLGGDTTEDIARQLSALGADARAGRAPAPAPPDPALGEAAVRLAIDFADATDLAAKAQRAGTALASDAAPVWKMLRSQGVFLGHGPAPRTAFLYTGQGSQYVNMLKGLRASEPVVAATFDEADRVMTPLLGRPLSEFIFIDADDPEAVSRLELQLLQTEITQPAVLATDLALTRLLEQYAITPDMVMGHSLGEYGALVAAGALSFDAALEAVSARGQEMASIEVADNGAMAAVFAPLHEIEEIVASAAGYAVIANVNSNSQAVVGGATEAVEHLVEQFTARGHTAVRIPVSHAFHTSIVAPATEPLKVALRRLDVRAPSLPIVANVTGEFYPADVTLDGMLDILGRQVASPVQFVKGLHTLYDAGARVFVEVGPKRALHGFAEDVLMSIHDDVSALFTNHPKNGAVESFNQALAGLYAAGHGFGPRPNGHAADRRPAGTSVVGGGTPAAATSPSAPPAVTTPPEPVHRAGAADAASVQAPATPGPAGDRYAQLGRLVAEILESGRDLITDRASPRQPAAPPSDEPVVITGAGIGLPGTDRVFDDVNLARLLNGEQFIDLFPTRLRNEIFDKRITRLVKREDGNHSFETITSQSEVTKLAGRKAPFDLGAEYGIPTERVETYDTTTELAIAAGFDALRDAGIPLVMHYKTTTVGTRLPERWGLPEELRDDTGVIFASAFPGMERFVDELSRYHTDLGRRRELADLEAIRARMDGGPAAAETDRRIADLRHTIESEPYTFDRRFLFRVIAFAHAQFAELIGARGPNTQVNAACASTTQAIGIAEDWITTGRCRRVVVISADDVTSDANLPWAASGFLATGAAATDDVVEEAALPFDNRRHGMLLGMGAAAFVVEAADAPRDRGIRPIAEVLSTVIANSAFHGTRLDVEHIRHVMDRLLRRAEARGEDRRRMAPRTVFVSHETYTPARGGSAAAEINALRYCFGDQADAVVIANTKGYTGHAMGAGIEDVLAVKALETGIVPPIPNYREVDPALGRLNLSRGGAYDVDYALRLGAGFGSQISMTLLRWTPMPDGRRRAPHELGFSYRITDRAAWEQWLQRVSGQDRPDLEVAQRKLRLVDRGAPSRTPRAPQVEQAPALAPLGPEGEWTPIDPAERSTAPAPAAPAPAPAPAPIAGSPVAPAVRPDVRSGDLPSETIGTVHKGGDPVAARVRAMVAELTGYPDDLLDLDLDLEADLGVDTVKQAEVFAAVRDEFAIERDDNLRLRDFPTLSHVIGFVHDRATRLPAGTIAPDETTRVPAEVAGPQPGAQEPSGDPVVATVTTVVSELTGYPEDLLDLDLDLEADLGIDTVKQAEVFAALRAEFGIDREDALQLRDFPTLNHVVDFMRQRATTLPAAAAGAAAAMPPAATSPAATAPAPGQPVGDVVTTTTVAVVAELTGYPEDLLDLDLDLEADLGIDTVKQAEVFAALRERFGVDRDDSLQLRDFPTLGQVIGYMRERAGLEAPAAISETATAAPTAPDAVHTPTPAAPEPSAPVAGADAVTSAVVATVAELTGYPEDLLDLDLDMEADLGIDTVKQAEVFAALRETFAIPRDDELQLRDFPTLTHVIGFMREGATTLPGQAAAEPAAATVSPELHVAPAIAGDLAATDRIPRRVPVPVRRPDLDACVPTGVKLDEGARVVVMPDAGGVGEALVGRLGKRGVEALMLDRGADRDAVTGQLSAWTAEGPVHGVFWLAALDDEGPIGDLDDDGWRREIERRVKLLSITMRELYAHIDAPERFLVSATRLGGYHGYDDAGATAPMGGAVTGFTKAFKREQMTATVKAVDFAASRKTAALADVLIDEALTDPGCVEVGRPETGRRWTVGLREVPFGEGEGVGDGEGALDVGDDAVFVVTGAAGSIVSAITADLAGAYGGTYHLLDLTPEPDPADPDLQQFATDRDGLKVTIAERLRAEGERPTPVLIEKRLAAYERQHAALTAIQAVTDAGGTVRYHSVDLTDPAAVAEVVDTIRAEHDRVSVLLHAAGLEISRSLPDKQPREYDLVFDVKSTGWFNLLRAAGDLPIDATVAFSSIAGRFGNAGQTDYSAANDLLCKYTSSFRRSRPDTRGIVVDWTAWGGIGMATRGSIPKVMEMAGIDMLPPEAGVAWIRRELSSSTDRGEVVVADALGILTDEFHPTGGLDPAAVDVHGAGPMLGTVRSAGVHSGWVVETTLDPTTQGFLDDHRIDGTPVLPGVMGVEAFAELAHLVAPDLSVVAVEDASFAAPFKFYRDEPRTLHIIAQVQAAGDDLLAVCRLEGERTLPGQAAPQRTVHFTGVVRLRTAAPEPVHAAVPGAPDGPVAQPDDIYRVYFHGPTYQVLAGAYGTEEGAVGRMAADLPANHTPDAPTVTPPRLVELCFQTAGVYEIGTTGQMALPLRIGAVEVVAADAADRAGVVAVTRSRSGGGFDADVVDPDGTVLVRLHDYRTVALPAAVDEALRAPLAAAVR